MLHQILANVALKLLLIKQTPFNYSKDYFIFCGDILIILAVYLFSRLLNKRETKEFLWSSIILMPILMFNFIELKNESFKIGLLMLSLVNIYNGFIWLGILFFSILIHFENCFLFIFIIFFIYHFGLYKQNRCKISEISFSFICVASSISYMIYANNLPSINWKTLLFILILNSGSYFTLLKHPHSRSLHWVTVTNTLLLHILGFCSYSYSFILFWLILDNLVQSFNLTMLFACISQLEILDLPLIRSLLVLSHLIWSIQTLNQMKLIKINLLAKSFLFIFIGLFILTCIEYFPSEWFINSRKIFLFYIWTHLNINILKK